MDKQMMIEDGAICGASPRIFLTTSKTQSSFDLHLETEKGESLATIAVDYFGGKLKTLVFLPAAEEPAEIIEIKELSKK